MIHEQNSNAFCVEDISKIENYEQAINDKTQTWDCHHRAEILPCGRFSAEVLKKFGLYYHRPADELIFLIRSDHIRLHNTGKTLSEESRAKLSGTRKAKIASGEIVVDTSACHTEEANKKISEKAKERFADKSNHPMFGKHHSDESRNKMSKAKTGTTLTEEHRRRISDSVKASMTVERREQMSKRLKGNKRVKGKHWKLTDETKARMSAAFKQRKYSDEAKRNMSEGRRKYLESNPDAMKQIGEKRRGLRWYNNGTSNRIFDPNSVPEGWKLGMLHI